jgi:hypothetical protein
MRHWVLAACLLAYPQAVRRRDGHHLVDLALELAERSGASRQALSFVRGGLAARAAGIPRMALVAVGGVAAAAVAIGGLTVQGGSRQVEVQSCAGPECSAVAAWAAGLERSGWECDHSSFREDVTWQCTRS